MTSAHAPAKINLALVVGQHRADGLHEIVTVFQRVDLCDRLELERSDGLRVEGFAADTLVRDALQGVAEAAGVEPGWAVRIEKLIPLAAGLGGGSSDAATALALANATLDRPLPRKRLHELARTLGADVPFFLGHGPHLGTGDGSNLEPVDLPQDYVCVLCLPADTAKESTAAVYRAFDDSGRAGGFAGRRDHLLAAIVARDIGAFPPNDLASSPVANELLALGAFRADVSGAGPTVYGLFHDGAEAEEAARVVAARGRVWVTKPAW